MSDKIHEIKSLKKNIFNDERFTYFIYSGKNAISSSTQMLLSLQIIILLVYEILLNEINSVYLRSNCKRKSWLPEHPSIHKKLAQFYSNSLDKNIYSSPEVDIFISAFKEIAPNGISQDLYIFWRVMLLNELTSIDGGKTFITKAEFINLFVAKIFEKTQEKSYKQKVQNRLDKSRNQKNKANKLFSNLFSIFSKLLIIRVDLAIHPENEVNLDYIKACMEKFLKSLHYPKDGIPHIEGFIWKLEFGALKGHHFHCIFIMNGNQYKQDSHYAQQLGELWKKVTNGKGIYHNCNSSKSKYRKLAIGTISHDDDAARSNIELMIDYIVKTDQFIIEKTLTKYRTFGVSSRKLNKSNRGRPRNQ